MNRKKTLIWSFTWNWANSVNSYYAHKISKSSRWIITAIIFISHLRKLNFRDNNNVSMILDTAVNDETPDQQAAQSSIHQSLIWNNTYLLCARKADWSSGTQGWFSVAIAILVFSTFHYLSLWGLFSLFVFLTLWWLSWMLIICMLVTQILPFVMITGGLLFWFLFVYTDSRLFLSYHAEPCVSSMYVTGNLFLLGLKVMLDVCVNTLSLSVVSDPLRLHGL